MKLIAYIRARRSFDLLVVGSVAIVGLGTALINPVAPLLRAVVLLPIVLAVTGYVFTSAVLPDMQLGGFEQACFSFGVSLSIVVIGGLLLNGLPIGLVRLPWILLLLGIILISSIVTLIRRPSREESPNTPNARLPILGIAQFLIAILLVTAAFGVASAGVQQQPTNPFTQLWVIPANPSNGHHYQVGIKNMEQKPMTYTLRVAADGKSVREWTRITLEPGDQWQTEYISLADASASDTLTFNLYLAEAPDQIYRHVVVYRSGVNQTGSQPSAPSQ